MRRLAIIGSGLMGTTLGGLWARAGHRVTFASRHPEARREALARIPCASTATVEEAAAAGEALLLAVPYLAMPELAARLAPLVQGKLVLDAGNVIPVRDGPLAAAVKAEGRGSGSHTAALLPGARVVKAFNTVFWKTLETQAHRAGPRIGVPLAGDEPAALAAAAELVEEAGFEPVLLPGGMAASARLDFGSPVWNNNLDAAAVRRALGL